MFINENDLIDMKELGFKIRKMKSGVARFRFTASGETVVGSIQRSRKNGSVVFYHVFLEQTVEGIKHKFLQVVKVENGNTMKAYVQAQNLAGGIARAIHVQHSRTVQLQLFNI